MAPPFRASSLANAPPVPADADLAWFSDHGLWGSIRRIAWSDGRLFEWSTEGEERHWNVDPRRVRKVIDALSAERFWEWTTSDMPLPDEVKSELRVRTTDGVREVSLWAHDWRSGRAAWCRSLVDQLFDSPTGTDP